MGFGTTTGEQHANNQVVSDDEIISTSAIQNAVFCVRGGGANGPCIGIDLGKLFICIHKLQLQEFGSAHA